MASNWADGIIVCFPDEMTARAAAAGMGMEFPADGSIPTGNGNYAMAAPITPPWQSEPVVTGSGETTVVATPGIRMPGFWALLRLNMEWEGYEATWEAIQASGALYNGPPTIAWA
jgi:hypothetical protein